MSDLIFGANRRQRDFFEQNIEDFGHRRMTDEHFSVNAKNPNNRWVGQHHQYPDLTGQRKVEGGIRLNPASPPSKFEGPRVSVITVVFNRDQTIERAIQSVADQDYKNIEHIIIDGGSDDGTLSILEKYRDHLDYYISEPDDGVYHAMNKGISLATGDYICLLNADDHYDPKYISSCVAVSRNGEADIICGPIIMNGTLVAPYEMNSGILLGHLNFFHGTFFVSRQCYDEVGRYQENYRIVSDTLWVQKAFELGKSFEICSESIVYFSDGGLSSGNTLERRDLLIGETSRMYRERFQFLTEEDAREIYLFRFSKNRLRILERIALRYCDYDPAFEDALRNYVEYCFSQRLAFQFEKDDIEDYYSDATKLVRLLGIDLLKLKINLPGYDISALFEQIDELTSRIRASREGGKIVILHFAEKFSTPSETFIYDLLQRLQSSGWAENVILCDERRLSEERRFDGCIEIPWPALPYQLKIVLYKRLLERLDPDVLLCHFAASGRWLYDRIAGLDLRIPTIHMTHGIDVFAISTNSVYREFILRHAVLDPQTEFTAVSEYLATELIARGVPDNKITVISNVVHPRFFENRKTSDYFDYSREFRILSIGRLIELKGHRYLLEGLCYFLDENDVDVRLTILYGNDDRNLNNLQEKINGLALEPYVELLDYVNFSESPDFYTKYDLFVLPSTYSDDALKRSESFGMSTLEAIASGLPVIVTDAGGCPEVIGRENKFAKIVPHANGKEIGAAISKFYQQQDAFSDNIEYAKSCLERFNPDRQLDLLRQVIDRVVRPRVKTVIFSSIASGGAGGAAVRVHEGLLRVGAHSTFVTRDHQHIERKVPFIKKIKPDLAGHWDVLQMRENQRPGHTIFTVNEPRLKQETIHDIVKDADVINIHWVARMLSVENIAYLSHLGKPVVITVRDMHPLSGGCHFFHGCDRWQTDCFSCPQLMHDERKFPHLIQKYKLQNWNRKNITIVALSRHSARLIEKSPLFHGCRIEIIANPIDLDVFSPLPQRAARDDLGIPQEVPAVFYIPSFDSKVKGREELREAMELLRKMHPNLRLNVIVAGAGAVNVADHEFPFHTINLGMIHDKTQLAKIYSAVDATVIPSLEETFSNTAAESAACGTPVVGFATGAIGEIGLKNERGATVEIGDCAGLATGIHEVIFGPSLRQNCRDYALENFSFERQGARYRELFDSLKQEYSSRPVADANEVAIPLINEDSAPLYFERQTKTYEFKRKAAIEQATKESQSRIQQLESRLSHIKAMANNAVSSAKPHDNLDGDVRLGAPIAARVMAYLRKRNTAAFRVAQLGVWAVSCFRHRPILAGLSIAFLFCLFATPLIIPSLSSSQPMFLIAALIFASLGALWLGLSFVRHKLVMLQQIINRGERFRHRVIAELKNSK